MDSAGRHASGSHNGGQELALKATPGQFEAFGRGYGLVTVRNCETLSGCQSGWRQKNCGTADAGCAARRPHWRRAALCACQTMAPSSQHKDVAQNPGTGQTCCRSIPRHCPNRSRGDSPRHVPTRLHLAGVCWPSGTRLALRTSSDARRHLRGRTDASGHIAVVPSGRRACAAWPVDPAQRPGAGSTLLRTSSPRVHTHRLRQTPGTAPS